MLLIIADLELNITVHFGILNQPEIVLHIPEVRVNRRKPQKNEPDIEKAAFNRNYQRKNDCHGTHTIFHKIRKIFLFAIRIFRKGHSIKTLSHSKHEWRENHNILKNLNDLILPTSDSVHRLLPNNMHAITACIKEISQRNSK